MMKPILFRGRRKLRPGKEYLPQDSLLTKLDHRVSEEKARITSTTAT